jgi:CBS domain-containing protein
MKGLVRDVMTTEVVTIQPWTPFREIVTRLAEHRISAAPVLDAEGNVLGSSPGRPGVLHVLLGGPPEARIRQGMEIEGLDRKTAEWRQQANDRARTEYVRHSYGVDPLDPDLYHLVLDSSAARPHSGPSRISA